MAWLHGQPVAVLGHAAQRIYVADVQLRVYALAEHIPGQVHDIHIAGPLAVAEKRSLDAIRTGHQAELRRSHGRAAIVVGVERQGHRIAPRYVAVEPFDGVAVDIGRVHLHSGRQIQNDRTRRRRLDHVHNRHADLERIVELRPGEALRRELVPDLGARYAAFLLQADLRRVNSDLRHAFLVQPKDDAALQNRG